MMNNPMQMITQFMQFRNQFQGDPKQQVEHLLRTGRMTQEQFNELQKQATTFQNMIKTFRM